MRSVRLRSWLNDLRAVAGTPGLDDTGAFRQSGYYARRRAFSRLNLFLCCFLVSAVLAPLNRVGVVLVIGIACFGGYLYGLAHASARNLQIRRKVRELAVEGDELEVRFEVQNPSSFQLHDLLIRDQFSGSTQQEFNAWLDEPLGPYRIYKGSYKVRCDAGMGVFRFGPIAALVSDPLGIFQFVVTEDSPSTVQVYPRLASIPELPIRGSSESTSYGLYDVSTRGLSANFIGVRDYARGDSLRHISWKLSLKARKLLVKEFEKSVNTEVSVLLEMDARNHMGRKSASTWQYAKDAALAVLSQQVANGNHIQLISNYCHIPSGNGEAHNSLVISSVYDLMPRLRGPAASQDAKAALNGTKAAPQDDRSLPERAGPLLTIGTTAVYIGPIFNEVSEAFMTSLLSLPARGVSLICILIDAPSFVKGLSGPARSFVEPLLPKAKDSLQKTTHRLAAAGVPVYVLENSKDIGRALLRPMVG